MMATRPTLRNFILSCLWVVGYVLGRVRDFVVNRTVIGNLVQNLGFVGCRFGASDSQVLYHVVIALAYRMWGTCAPLFC